MKNSGSTLGQELFNVTPTELWQEVEVEVESCSQQVTIGLALFHQYWRLRGTGAIIWLNAGWQNAGLTKVPYLNAAAREDRFKESFLEAAGNPKTGAIRVEMSGYDPAYPKSNIFQWELNTIAGNATLASKTYYVNNATQ